jgi:hypothetical protein
MTLRAINNQIEDAKGKLVRNHHAGIHHYDHYLQRWHRFMLARKAALILAGHDEESRETALYWEENNWEGKPWS